VLLPLAAAILYEPERDDPEPPPPPKPKVVRRKSTVRATVPAAPRNVSRPVPPRQCPKPDPERWHPIRREPLDEEARAEGTAALARLRAAWLRAFEEEQRQNAAGHFRFCGCFPSSFLRQEAEGGWTEIDLLLRGYPAIAEAWAVSVAGDHTAPRWERRRAVEVVCLLAWHGFARAVAAVERLRTDADDWIRERTQQVVVHHSNPESLRASARAGVIPAIEALVVGPDAEASEILDEIERTRPPHTAYGDPVWTAEGCRVQLASFACGNWAEVAREFIRKGASDDLPWALEAAKARRAGWLGEALRAALDADHERWSRHGEGGVLKVDTGWGFDEVLLALVEIDGPLREDERIYLRRYGYACDPRERLREILEEKRYPR